MVDFERSRMDSLLAERDRARRYLWSEMEKLGLREKDGWSITEFTREDKGGTQIVMRPMHRHLPAPHGLECVVGIIEHDGGITGRCTGPDGQPVDPS